MRPGAAADGYREPDRVLAFAPFQKFNLAMLVKMPSRLGLHRRERGLR
jgi:hypothetical protein